jgi:hypothetical protein
VGSAPEHYRCYRLFIPETGGTRISGTVELFLHYSTVPKLSSADAATHAARDLILALERPYPQTPFPMLSTRHITAHHTRPITFTLVVDDFGIKYEGDTHSHHLIDTLKKYYTVATDWTGSLHCGIQLDWMYDYPQRHLDISMPKYVASKRKEFDQPDPAQPQHSPHPAPPMRYGHSAQDPAPPDKAPPLPPEKHKRVQKIIGSFLYYGRAINLTILKALNSLARQQSTLTTTTLDKTTHLRDYLATHPDAVI